jgi:hypothetical protein
VTVTACDTRRAAAPFAADAYRDHQNARGQTPAQVRIIRAAQLCREEGWSALGRVAADLADREEHDR